jgi:hypothetical protein
VGGGPELPQAPRSVFSCRKHTPYPFARSAPRTDDALNLAVSRASNDQHVEQDTRMFGGWLKERGFCCRVLCCWRSPWHRMRMAPGEFKLLTDADDTFTSPDRQVRVGNTPRIWRRRLLAPVLDLRRQASTCLLLNPGETPNSRATRRLSIPEQPVAGANANIGAGFGRSFVPAERNEFSSATQTLAISLGLFLRLPVSKSAPRPEGTGFAQSCQAPDQRSRQLRVEDAGPTAAIW